MRLLHDKDDICPLKQFWRHWIIRIIVQSGRGNIYPRTIGKYLLGSRAT